MRPSLPGLALVVCLLAGCEKGPSFQEIETTNKALATEVKTETGKEALVGFMKHGSDLKVTVTLVSTSKPDADAAKPKIEAIVKRHWPKVTSVVVEAGP